MAECVGCTQEWAPNRTTPIFFQGFDGAACYRIPSGIKTSKGTLLAFAEQRLSNCGDDGQLNIVLRRSVDDGHTWGKIITVVVGKPPCATCPAATSNANPVEVKQADGTMAVLLHYDTMNNPEPGRHGLDMQTWSFDDGLTWAAGTVLKYPPQPNIGAMVGPSVGIQAATGRIFFSAHLAYSYWTAGWAGADTDVAFLYWSDDFGRSWRASESVPGLNECSISFLVDAHDGRVLMNCRTTSGNPRAQLVWHPNASLARDGPGGATHDKGRKRSKVGDVKFELQTSGATTSRFTHGAVGKGGPPVTGCQGSLVRFAGAHYASYPSSQSSRQELDVYRSTDGGASWSSIKRVWAGPSAYSQLVPLDESTGLMGLLLEAGYGSPYETIEFVSFTVPMPPPPPPELQASSSLPPVPPSPALI